MNNVSTAEIELDIKEAKEFVALGYALEQLEKNKYFKQLIAQGYFKDEAVRLVSAKASPSMQDPKFQTAVLTAIDGIGALMQYFGKVQHQAEMAESAIESSEEQLREMDLEGEV